MRAIDTVAQAIRGSSAGFIVEAVAQGAWPLATGRPKLTLSVRPSCGRNGSGTGHRLRNLAERQLFDLMAGRKQRQPVLKRSLMQGARMLNYRRSESGSSRHFPDLYLLR